MFEFIKWLLLVALMAGIGDAAMNLEKFDAELFHSCATTVIALVDLLLVVIIGLITVCTVPSGNFPQEISDGVTIIIIVEFIYMLFVYGKVIPGYTNSDIVIPKNKETIKID